VFVIRTRRVPFFHSRPSRPLLITTLAVVLVGLLIPYSPVAGALGFRTLPWAFLAILVGMAATPDEPVGVFRRRAQGLLELIARSGMTQSELELRLQEREGCSQLMACVVDEPPLVLERGLEAGEHVVQRFRQAGQLVPARRDGQPLPGGGRRDCSCPAAHRLDGAESGGGDPVAGENREQERGRASDQELVQEAVECLVALLERASDHRDSGVPADVRGYRQRSPLAVETPDRAAVPVPRPGRDGTDLGVGQDRRQPAGRGLRNRAVRAQDLSDLRGVGAISVRRLPPVGMRGDRARRTSARRRASSSANENGFKR